MGGASSIYEEEKMWIQNFGWKTWGKESAW